MTKRQFLGGKRKFLKGGSSGVAASASEFSSSQPSQVTDYGSASRWMESTVGSGQQQFDNVFGAGNNSMSNAIRGLNGQSAGRGKRKGRKTKKGGNFGGIINQAVVPFAVLGLQQTFRTGKQSSRGRSFKKRGRSTRRR